MNPWWRDPKAIREDPHIYQIAGRSFYFDNPLKKRLALQPGTTFVLRGGRQVGKTTLLKEKILEAIAGPFAPEDCLYLSCETLENFRELSDLLSAWIMGRKDRNLLVCLDEVTFVTEWQRALLWLINAGLLKNATTLITGSNARDLKKSAERFPGRNVEEIKVFPVSLIDYGQIPCFQNLPAAERLEIYLQTGGFPHAIRDYAEGRTVTDETYETYANWIFGDAHRFHLTRDLLTHILYKIFDTAGSQVTWQRLIEQSPVRSHETAALYVEHLELAFLCTVLPCYDPAKEMGAPRKAKKIYFVDPLLYGVVGGYLRGLRNIHKWWRKKLEDKEFRGNLFESVVANHFARHNDPVYYWYSSRLKREIDLLVPRGSSLKLFEIKSQSQDVRPALGHEVTVISPELFSNHPETAVP